MIPHDQTVRFHTSAWCLPKIWNNDVTEIVCIVDKSNLHHKQQLSHKELNQTVTFRYTAKYDMILSEVLNFFWVLHEKVYYWEGVIWCAQILR